MRPLLDMDVIQIEITNACVHQCANCTRLVGHSKKPFFMDLDFFKKAVDSLVDYPKIIGIMGGEPLLHPQFTEMAAYLKSKVPDKIKCGLWSTLPKGKEKYAPIIADVFGNVLLNDHTLGKLYHSPILVSANESVVDKFKMWYLIDHCWVQNCWSASINPKGAFFCEIAAAFDIVFDGPGGWTVSPEWWKKTPKDYVEQMKQYCVNCSAALPLHARLDTEETDDISKGNLERLIKVGSPKVKRGKYSIYDKGERDSNYHINEFRNNIEYQMKIADKYGLYLRQNKLGYLQPFLKNTPKSQDEINIKDCLQKGHTYHQAGNLKEASILYQKILAQQQEHIDANFLLGTLYLQAGNLDKAAELLQKTVLLKPDHVEANNNLGTVLQNQGKLDEAAESYKRALCLAPDYSEAFYNLGNIFYKQHKFNKAIEHYKQAIILKPDDHEAFLNLGNVFKELGKIDDAEREYRKSISLKPDYPVAHSRLGAILQELGKLDESIKSIKRAQILDPDNIDILNNLATILSKQGEYDEAIESYNRALKLKPDAYLIQTNLASTLKDSGRLEEALTSCNKAIEINPNYPESHNTLGVILQGSGQLEEAVKSYKKAIELQPDNPELYSNLGSVLKELDRFDEAVECCKHSIELNPENADAFNNLGTILQEQRKLDEAIANYKQAIKLMPDHARAHSNLGTVSQKQGNTVEAVLYCHLAVTLNPGSAELHNNLGAILQKQERVDEAITCYDNAIELEPDYTEAHLNRSFALLLTGKYKEGWEENEWRLKTKAHCLRKFHNLRWDGSPLKGKTILVYAEQGFGDTIQFVRYLPMVQEQGGRVIFECHKSLHRLLRDCTGIDKVVEKTTEPKITFDTHISLLSLPGIFNTTLNSIPSETPYISVNSGLAKLWRNLHTYNNDFKIGIVWAGNAENKRDNIRSCSLKDFYPLLNIQGTAFYSLQKGPASGETENTPPGIKIINLNNQLRDFADTAAIIDNLDLVISVDTAVAHLAGALGKPVWNLLHFAPDWRWLLNRNDSPWYPEMRLFRQNILNDWTYLFKEVKNALLQEVNDIKKNN
ncbi:hypothetical protein SCALIN_C05_0095 [Candidatus Scalindua japonica]|uniref:Uncharacterized protein n=1 Tax=Candidatus Scalindua japonica TaxID=1284222 RepID=A0A286TVU6_9BACT|nr:tetratricopeptide repeat protein [Candidatus Scalindua japonica]GAX60010.1 hypothetical protein SCALIN_C05_0095 [Candidatus Scalindua japonica]